MKNEYRYGVEECRIFSAWLLLDRGPEPTFEEAWDTRVKAMQDRQERQFQDDWTMAIGMDVLRDQGLL